MNRLGLSLGSAPLLVVTALALITGDIVAGSGHSMAPALLATLAGSSGALMLLPHPAWKRVTIAAIAFALAAQRADRVYRPEFPPDHVAVAPMHTPLQLEAVLAEDPEPLAERVRFTLAAERVAGTGGWQPVHGQIQLTVRHLEQTWLAGDCIRVRLSLRRPRNFGNPGEFDYQGYLARRDIYVTAFAADDSGISRLDHVDGGRGEWLARWRRGVGALFQRSMPALEAGVLSALIIGTEGALPRDLRTAFSRAGVSHVLSISGLHVALVAGAGYALFRWLLARSRWLLLSTNVPKLATAFSVVPVLLYAGIAGSNVATTRSVVMIVVFVVAVLVDRQRHLVISLAAAAVAILLVSPGAAMDISFQLSFVSVLGLVWGMERFWPWWTTWEEAHLLRLRGWRGRLWRPAALYVVVSVSALAATTPLTAWHFNQVSLVALVANAVVVPLLGSVAVGLGLTSALLYAVCEPLARCCAVVSTPVVGLGVWLVELLAAVPYASLRVVTPTVVELVLVYAGLYSLVRFSGRTRARSLSLVVILGLIDGVWWWGKRYHRAAMTVTFLSVGQGDSAVIELPGSEVMVIDGGGLGVEALDVGERVVAPFLWSRKIAHVDYLVLSHADADHYGGLLFLAANFSPREFWWNGAAAESERFARLQQILSDTGVRRRTLRRGDQRRIGAVEVRVHSPPAQLDGWSDNNRSLVVTLGLQGTGLLFPGDIEQQAESDLVAADGTLASAILKVPHHGSRSSSSARFLDAVAPRLAVISAGFDNRFHFPDRNVLRRYAAHRCEVARTDLDGAVQVRIDTRGDIQVRRYRKLLPAGAIVVDTQGPQG